MPALKWTDADEIGHRLHQADPGADPLAVRFIELRDCVTALADFDDDPSACSEGALEAIQMAWVDWAGRDQ